ncbi:MAG: hypothetical protein MO846_05730 [Candidatus Devosia symbiotica]|nr:hypothetical protein [Candidatus Devosia symbiotica]
MVRPAPQQPRIFAAVRAALDRGRPGAAGPATRVKRAREEVEEGSDYSLLIFQSDGRKQTLVSGVTLSNVRRRAAQFVNLSYWMVSNLPARAS